MFFPHACIYVFPHALFSLLYICSMNNLNLIEERNVFAIKGHSIQPIFNLKFLLTENMYVYGGREVAEKKWKSQINLGALMVVLFLKSTLWDPWVAVV